MTQWISGKSFEEIEAKMMTLITAEVYRAMQKVTIDVYNILKDKTFQWYMEYTPDPDDGGYERTFQFFDSLTMGNVIASSNGIDVEIYFDTNKLVTNYSKRQHNEKDRLPWIIEEGWDQNMRGGRGAYILRDTINELKSGKLNDMFRKYMKGSGITVYVKSL